MLSIKIFSILKYINLFITMTVSKSCALNFAKTLVAVLYLKFLIRIHFSNLLNTQSSLIKFNE